MEVREEILTPLEHFVVEPDQIQRDDSITDAT